MPNVRFRRVVTGHDAGGTAVVAIDGQPPNVRSFNSIPGVYFTEVWSTAQTPAIVTNDDDPTLGATGIAPPRCGTIIRVVDIPPEKDNGEIKAEAAKAHFAEIGSASAATVSTGSKHGLMHRTETIDYGIVLEGSLTLVLDESEVELQQGDIVVQRGTNHAWSNRSGKLCRMAFVLIDGQYEPKLKAAIDRRSAGQ